MNIRSFLLLVLMFFLGGVGGFIFGAKYAEAPMHDGGAVTEEDKSNLIRVTSLQKGQRVTSPILVQGEARGGWYFEASFPVRIEDAAGNVLAEAPAQAQGEWMTENFVPFSLTLTFKAPVGTKEGFVVLQKDNPSGLPENDDELRIPVAF